MNFYKPIHIIFGEYIFETDQNTFPRFANLLVTGKLNFWGTTYIDGRVRFCSSIFSADKILAVAQETHSPIELIGKKGIPFFFSKYRKRYGFILGMAFGLFLLFYSQLFVWKINISGNTTVTNAEIEQALAESNISVGSFIPAIDSGRAENILLLNHRELSSVAISIRGNHIGVSVLERTEIPEIVDTKGYYNVISTHDGIILDMDAAEGTPEVTEGDVVYEGQLLINSFIEGKYGSVRPTHARGIVYAAVEEKIKIEIPLERTVRNYTGNTETKTMYSVLGHNFPLFINETTRYEYFDAVSVFENVRLFGFIDLPIRKSRTSYSEYTLKTERITPETAKKIAQAELKHTLSEIGAEVLDCETSFITDEIKGVCILNANATLKLNIAKEVEFNLNQSISDKLPNESE